MQIPIGAILLLCSSCVLAQARPLIEEILVTAQRVEEKSQKVPIAVSPFTDAMIDDRQLIGILDVQLFVPNFTATETNVGARVIAVRGVGRLLEGAISAQNAVSYQINEIPFPVSPLTEFYDLERLEVLRGPQGTLFGRNSTAGAVNAVTRRPKFEGFAGEASIDVGDYDLFRIRGAVEGNITDRLAVRIAGLSVDRDGYIENLANGQVPGVDRDLDGRDLTSFRITPEWRISDQTTVWMLYEHTDEDDDRVRITNQVCKTNPVPTTGCLPDEFGLEPIHPSSTSWGIMAGFNGLIPLGARDETTGLNFDFARPKLSLREQHTDLEPEYRLTNKTGLFGLNHNVADLEISLLGGYSRQTYLSRQDRYMDVGYTLEPTSFNPSGLWPTSEPPTRKGDPFVNPCNLLLGQAGVTGGCVVDADLTRFFAFDQLGYTLEAWTAEMRFSKISDAPVNWQFGLQYSQSNLDFDYYIPNNVFDSFALFGVPVAVGGPVPRVYPMLDAAYGDFKSENYSAFGEVYWSPSDRVKLTFGLRYAEDEVRSRGVYVNGDSFDVSFLDPQFDPSAAPSWYRVGFGSWLDGSPTPEALALADYYGLTQEALAASDQSELISVLQQAPPVQTLGEAKAVFNLPDRYKTDSITGRIGVDWQMTSDSMIYFFYSRGQNPGGLNGFSEYDDERVNAFELGSKNLLLDGSLLVNVAGFYNAYDGLQLEGRGEGVRSTIDNVDADVWGIEVEARWRSSANLEIDLAYGWMKTEIDDFGIIDVMDLSQGNPDFVVLRDVDGFFNAGGNYVASRPQTLTATPQAIEIGAAIPAPGTTYSDGIPAYFNRAYLAAIGVPVFDGLSANLDGNNLPNAPEHTVNLGIAYTWFMGIGALTARWDYHWQDKMFGRVFNTSGDKIKSWDQHNASISLQTPNGHWLVKAWIRNIEDEDNITDHYVHNVDLAGPFRNYFLMEPRVYGATIKYIFGEG